MTLPDANAWRDLGDFAVVREHSIGLSCHHCRVTWTGCAAEACCPKCGAPKGYWPADYDRCYCEVCVAERGDEPGPVRSSDRDDADFDSVPL